MNVCVGGALNVLITTLGVWRCIQSDRLSETGESTAVRAGITDVSHVTNPNIPNVDYRCHKPTSAKCSKFRPLQTLLYLTECDMSWHFI
jgi:adenosylcobinamide amidohydrolase